MGPCSSQGCGRPTWLHDQRALQPLNAQGFQQGQAADAVLQAGEAGEADGQVPEGRQAQQGLRQGVVRVVVLGRQAHLLQQTHSCSGFRVYG